MRCELSDFEWAAIKPLLPNKPRGVARVNDRRMLNGIFWVLRSGAPCPCPSGLRVREKGCGVSGELSASGIRRRPRGSRPA